ncbi:hypothetical protein PHMEG_00010720 [Phytophthora megakarya]|uniref:Bzip transcription factor n=1 Tax=Phytophthora megakarya TaxID=4795 RepID=A0A225WFH0_9STRA|nr:hypothetical protein PHMEG_00010720 [Phytophthora megakarya]
MDPQTIETPSSVEAAKLAFRRRRGRIHQARHRGKQRKGLQNLQESLDTLREEIAQLNTEKHITSLYMSMDLTAMKVVAEYFRLFRFGILQGDLSTSDIIPGGSIPVVQRCFLNAAMTPDVTDGTVVGVNAIMVSWERMSLCFPGLEIEPTCLENGSDGSIVATTQQNLTVNENMLQCAFPHLIQECGEYSQLVKKLLGHHILIRGSVCFKWDKENGRVSSFDFKADLVTPMLRLLDNLEDVSHVFSKAHLTPECGLVAGL